MPKMQFELSEIFTNDEIKTIMNSGMDLDGDIIFHNGVKYYINAMENIVIKY